MSNADEMIKKIRVVTKDKDKAASPKVNPDDFKVRLLIMPLRRRQLIIALLFGYAVMVTILARDMNLDKSWWVTGLPIIGVGLLLCLIPPTEIWEYKPWQTRARQYERHQLER